MDKRYRAQIDKIVEQRARFKVLDTVKVLTGTNKGKIGFVHTISSLTNITNIKSTRISYLVRFSDGRSGLVAYSDNELQKVIAPEKVSFT